MGLGSGFRVQDSEDPGFDGLGFRVLGFGFSVQGLGFQDLGFRVEGQGSRVEGFGFRGFRV
jgi:hypothetical protein